MNYDIIIPVTERNFQTLGLVANQIKKYVLHRNIILIGKCEFRDRANILGCKFINEDTLYGKLDYCTIRELIYKRDKYAVKRTGWYLQQFLKMSYSMICEDEYYLVWDADTIPLVKMEMFDDKGVPFFDVKEEYHRPYFTTLNRLFNATVKKFNSYSYISEHMLIKVEYMRKLIDDIEKNDSLEGEFYYEKVMNCIRKIDISYSGFSEFETYGNYVENNYVGKYKIRRLRTLRNGDRYLHYPPIQREVEWAAGSYDILSMENRLSMYVEVDKRMNELMKDYTLEEVVKTYSKL